MMPASLVLAAKNAAGVYVVDQWGLLVAVALVCVAAGLSELLRLQVGRSLLISAARSLLQLLAMGLVIKWVIQMRSWGIVLALIALMVCAAVQICLSRAHGIPAGLGWDVFLTLLVTVLLIVSVLVEGVIRPRPWYSAQVMIPVAGMMLGNTVSATAVAMTRFFESMRARRDEIDTMLALGATPWEASRPSVLSSVRLGMLPTVATLASSGIVMIPGMMAGQVIAGLDPTNAAVYQFVVLAAISSLTLVADTLILVLVFRRCFTAEDASHAVEPREKVHTGWAATLRAKQGSSRRERGSSVREGR